jgi:PAS domain-containing protein
LRSVLENVPAGILILRGPQLIIEYVSPGMQAISPRLVEGRPVAEVTTIWPQIEAIVERVWRTGEPFRAAEMLLRRRAEMPEGTTPPLEAIKRGADRLNRIVEDLLSGLAAPRGRAGAPAGTG